MSTGVWLPVPKKEPTLKVLNSAECDTFFSDPDVDGNCPIARVPHAIVPLELFQTWIELAKDFNTEWIAYLKGHWNEDGNAVVEEMYIPPQVANGVHCQPLDDFKPQPGTIGAVHSHVKMDVFFSGEDKKHANWPLEMVVNARGEIKAAIRFKLLCGKYVRMDAKVKVAASDGYSGRVSELKTALDAGEERRKEKNRDELKYVAQQTTGQGARPMFVAQTERFRFDPKTTNSQDGYDRDYDDDYEGDFIEVMDPEDETLKIGDHQHEIDRLKKLIADHELAIMQKSQGGTGIDMETGQVVTQ